MSPTRTFFRGFAIVTIHLEVRPTPPAAPGAVSIALIGNPNAGKTTLFNALTGLRAKTANFPGTTVEHRSARVTLGGTAVEILDLPGLYSIGSTTPEEAIARDALLGHIPNLTKPSAVVLIIDATNLERNLYLASQILELKIPVVVALNMIDLADQYGLKIDVPALSTELGCPVVAISARSGQGIEDLRRQLELIVAAPADFKPKSSPACEACNGCAHSARYDWAEKVGAKCSSAPAMAHAGNTERLDRFLTHPVVGVLAFLGVMFIVFTLIFWLAQYPMNLIQALFGVVGDYTASGVAWLGGHVPAGVIQTFILDDMSSLLVKGVIGGVGGMLVFLPQIVILFFFLSVLEDTGYLARAAFVMDRLMGFAGLPGKAFVPLLSAHACAIPAIMSTRVIEDKRDRLVTILIAPFMSCSARIPVYTMIIWGLLQPQSRYIGGVWVPSAFIGAGLFTGAYCLGLGAALGMAFIFKHTILKGESKPLVLELPSYKVPSLKTAALHAYDRAMVFIKKAGTVIVLVSIILWALATYPKTAPPAEATTLKQRAEAAQKESEPRIAELTRQATDLHEQVDKLDPKAAGKVSELLAQAATLDAGADEKPTDASSDAKPAAKPAGPQPGDDLRARAKALSPIAYENLSQAADIEKQIEDLRAEPKEWLDQADHMTSQSALAHSFAGRIGHTIEPVLSPLGFNWQIGVGIISSFAAREVIVSTLAVVYGVGEDSAEENPKTLYQTMRGAVREDGSPLFTVATCMSLLVFYVLAMQCMSTLAVTRRETNGWKWPIFTWVYMSALAYGASFITYQALVSLGMH